MAGIREVCGTFCRWCQITGIYQEVIISHQRSWESMSINSQTNSLISEASIWFNAKIRIAKRPFFLEQWAKGSLHLGNLYDNGDMASFEYLKQNYNKANKDFWKYLQSSLSHEFWTWPKYHNSEFATIC